MLALLCSKRKEGLGAIWEMHQKLSNTQPVLITASPTTSEIANDEGAEGAYEVYVTGGGGSPLLLTAPLSPSTLASGSCLCCTGTQECGDDPRDGSGRGN